MLAIARFIIRFYQKFLSPALHLFGGSAGGCRFHPTCSDYFLQAIETHGLFRGTGLGLTFCRLVAETHGGRIWIDDNPTGGSIFSFTLPVALENELSASSD